MSIPTTTGGGDDRGGLAIDRLVSAAHRGQMPKLGAATATRAGLTIAGYGGDAAIGLDAATAALAGALTAAGFAKLATLQVPVSRLAYAAAADLLNGAAVAATTWTDLHANQAFSISSAASWLGIEIKLGFVATAAALAQLAARANFDSAGTPVLIPFAAGMVTPAGGFGALSGNHFYIPPNVLAAGAHTVKIQVFGAAALTAYCRPNTVPNTDWATIRVVEFNP